MDDNPAKTDFSIRRYWGWILTAAASAVAVLFLLFPRRPYPVADWRDPEAVAKGGALYQVHCQTCHGAAGIGENPPQPMGGEKPEGGYVAPALDGSGHAWHHRPDVLFDIVRNGSAAGDSPMRGFAGRLTDQEIAWTIAYFRSLWPPQIQDRYERMMRQ